MYNIKEMIKEVIKKMIKKFISFFHKNELDGTIDCY